MARRTHHEEHENHERWLVSYADFITLLFAFFVVMYAISSVNEGKYRVLSDALETAFHPEASTVVEQPGRPEGMESGAMSGSHEVIAGQGVTTEEPTPKTAAEDAQARPGGEALERIAEGVERSLAPLVDRQLVAVRKEDNWVEIELKSQLLFASGSAKLNEEASPVLRTLANLLWPYPNAIQVEGFTDNVPIATVAFRSNWDLSAARSASVVQAFSGMGMNPRRLSATGYGEHHPIAGNETEEGRAANRRVVLVVLAEGHGRHERTDAARKKIDGADFALGGGKP